MRVRAVPLAPEDGAGIAVRVVLEHAAGFHTWPHDPVIPAEFRGVMPIATAIEVVSLPEGASLETVEWPEPVPVTVRYTGDPVPLLSYTGTATAIVRVRPPATGMPAGSRLELRVRYQACDEYVCYPPKTVRLAVRISGGP